ncbi:MAG TPA: hypothetical protein VGV67_10085, partial [Solirubrobacteraceae bacterium]|nr:hypothetical protein [Solirubrobacteraceae bacterium]
MTLLTAIDLAIQPSTAVVGIVIVAPLLTMLFGETRDVALVGVLSILIVVLSAAWRDNFGEVLYLYRVGLVAAVAVIAVLAARTRAQARRDHARFAVLAAVAEIADGTLSLTDTVAGLNDIIVPSVADVCIVDTVSGGELQRLAVRADSTAG